VARDKHTACRSGLLHLLVGLLLGWSGLLSAQTVVLKEGGTVQGEILRRRADAVFVDLGFTVLRIPSEAIASISVPPTQAPAPPDSDPTASAPETAPRISALPADLFIEAKDPAERTVNDQVRLMGEAVVEIRTAIGLGSGFLINPQGFVVTNHHVIAGEQKLTVTAYRRQGGELQKLTYDQVRIVAFSPEDDLALLQIETPDAGPFPYLPLGDSDSVRPGQVVFAIGSPLGLERTVSQGIVSSRPRPLDGRLYLQTTTQINPGNSGGPLLNLRGEVVGVANMKVAMAGVEGLGFAIPVTHLKAFLRHREAYAFDPRNPNAGFRYYSPPSLVTTPLPGDQP
jgi:serine protease Do